MPLAHLVAEVDHAEEHLSGTFPIQPVVQVAFEREKKKSLRKLESMEDIYYLAWKATQAHLQSSGGTCPTFEAWLAGTVAADVVDGSGAAEVPLG